MKERNDPNTKYRKDMQHSSNLCQKSTFMRKNRPPIWLHLTNQLYAIYHTPSTSDTYNYFLHPLHQTWFSTVYNVLIIYIAQSDN